MTEHREDGLCWCDDETTRELASNRLWPDRCQIPGSPTAPNAGQRTCCEPAGHPEPCRGGLERRGGPCHFCGAMYDGDMCGDCWQSFDGMNLADIKAAFAAADLSIEQGEGGQA